ncbi:MAG: hypothetical protein IPK15_21850 [Verrucomicrobia bacterium]|nr:hypothetical protein [Verrucomicrobiota bacterium]
MKTIRFAFIAAVMTVTFSPETVQACATCFGQSDEAMAKGMNMGILTLLICITSVLLGMAGVGFYLVRRAARYASVTATNAAGDLGLPAGQTLK